MSDQSASRAVDSDFTTVACTDSTDSKQPWWTVDLGAPMDVDRVTVSNDINPKDPKLGKLAFSATTMSTTINTVSSITFWAYLTLSILVIILGMYPEIVPSPKISQNIGYWDILQPLKNREKVSCYL